MTHMLMRGRLAKKNATASIPLIIFLTLTVGTAVHAKGNKCESDPNHTMQQYVDDDINIGSLLRKNPAFRGDLKVLDTHRIPNDIKIMPLPEKGIYRNIRPSREYYLPEIDDEKFGSFAIGCRFSCDYQIKPMCMVKTRQGHEMLAFIPSKKNNEIFYVPKEDFELFRKSPYGNVK